MKHAADNASGLASCFLFPFLAAWLILVHHSLGGRPRDARVDEWAAREGYLLTRREQRTFFRGPFFLPAGRYHRVYRLTVLDDENRRHTGWVRISESFWRQEPRVDVRWDVAAPGASASPIAGDPRMWDRDLDS